ncbi:unnamed protein product, partial [Laminaria digitata]
MSLTGGYVRSQSVTDEVLPMERADSGSVFGSSEFDFSEDLTTDNPARRRGIVSRMRRTASSVIRHPFRTSSRNSNNTSQHSASSSLGGSGGSGNS